MHGHARESRWVVSHLRAPNRAQDGQLELADEEPEPAPRRIEMPRPREPADDAAHKDQHA